MKKYLIICQIKTKNPKINNIYDINNYNNELNVSERLFGYQNKYKEKLDLMRERYSNFTFKPNISKNTNIILNKKKLIQNLKDQIKNNIPDTNRELLLNENEKNQETETKIKNELKDDNNLENMDKNNTENKNETIEPILSTFSNQNNNYNINYNENNNENENTENNDNTYNNDFKIFMNKNEKRKDYNDSNNKNNKKIMDFAYYNNLI